MPDVVIIGHRLGATEAAVLVEEDGTGVSAWLARKLIRVEEGMFDAVRVTLPAWLARQKGLTGSAAPGQGRLL